MSVSRKKLWIITLSIFFSFFILIHVHAYFMRSDLVEKILHVAPERTSEYTSITIKGHRLYLEIADTPGEQIQGLSGRKNIGKYDGMLFSFGELGMYGMHMKDMHFPIDIIWVGDNGLVVGIEENVQPETYPNIFYPQWYARSVIELEAGMVQEIGLEMHDNVYRQ